MGPKITKYTIMKLYEPLYMCCSKFGDFPVESNGGRLVLVGT